MFKYGVIIRLKNNMDLIVNNKIIDIIEFSDNRKLKT